MALPAWLASMTQVPTATKVTVAPEMLQLPLAEGSIVKVTGLPLAPPLAVGMKVPPMTAGLGGAEVKVMLCAPRTGKDCWT